MGNGRTPFKMPDLLDDGSWAFADWLTRKVARDNPLWARVDLDATAEIDWVREQLPAWRVERPTEAHVTVDGEEYSVMAKPGQLMAIHAPVAGSPQPVIVEQSDLPPKFFVEACLTYLLRFSQEPELSDEEARRRYAAGERYIEEQTRKEHGK